MPPRIPPGRNKAVVQAPASAPPARRTGAAAAGAAIAADASGANRALFAAEPRVATKKKKKRALSPAHAADHDAPRSDDEDFEAELETHAAKRYRAAASAAAAAASPSAAAALPTLPTACLACNFVFRSDPLSAIFPFCPSCEMIPTVLATAPANVLRQAKVLAATASPPPASAASAISSQSDTTQASGKPKLGAYETELRRLLDCAVYPVPRAQQLDTISHEATIAGCRSNSYLGSSFMHQPPLLTCYIRSGHFKELSLALPRSNAAAASQREAESRGAKVLIGADGSLMSTAQLHHERSLNSLQEFQKVLIVSILPSLFDRPRAMLDWLELARSMTDLSEKEGWPVALRYLTDLMQDRAPSGAAFNVFDHNILATARASVATPLAGGPAAAAARPSAGGAPPQRVTFADVQFPMACRDWNLRADGCVKGAHCRYLHRCMFEACQTHTDGHKAHQCPKTPAGFVFPSPQGGGAAAGAKPNPRRSSLREGK